MIRLVALWTDVVLWLMVLALCGYLWRLYRHPNLRANWARVFADAPALCSSIVLAAFLVVTLLDSVHFRVALPPAPGAAPNAPLAYDVRTQSLLDALLAPLIASRETSYSVPLATHGFTKESQTRGGTAERVFPRLNFGGSHLKDAAADWLPDVLLRAAAGGAAGLLLAVLIGATLARWYGRRHGLSPRGAAERIVRNDTALPLRAALLTAALICLLAGAIAGLATGYHVFGTDRTGNDVLYQALKSVRTAFVIGTLATIATLPLAIVFGIAAGYFRGWVDELIQYIYTTLSSVPGVLLIAACVLMMQVFIDEHPEVFETGVERADIRIFLLCVILGLTGWAGLCRLLRGETLKLRELEFVQAASAFGVSHWRIMARHILPNVVHLVLITTVLEFSGLILYEAVLTYVGVGVDPSTNSFGAMINLARAEMSRDPLVWWSFAAAFAFMVTLVLAANLFADGVRDAFDPRARKFRARPLLARSAT